jgi:hypothetical protein
MREQFIYSTEDVLLMLDRLVSGGDDAWWAALPLRRGLPVGPAGQETERLTSVKQC